MHRVYCYSTYSMKQLLVFLGFGVPMKYVDQFEMKGV